MKLLLTLSIYLSSALVGTATAATDQDVRETIRQATTTLAAAEAAGFAWTTTEDLITQAEKALGEKRVEEAANLAERALKQAQNSVAQSENAQARWQDMKPK